MTHEEHDRKLDTLLALQLSTRRLLIEELAWQRAVLERLLGRPEMTMEQRLELAEQLAPRRECNQESLGTRAAEQLRIVREELGYKSEIHQGGS